MSMVGASATGPRLTMPTVAGTKSNHCVERTVTDGTGDCW